MITKMICVCDAVDITKSKVYIVQPKTDYDSVLHVLNDVGHWKYYPNQFFEPLRKMNLKKILWHLEQDI